MPGERRRSVFAGTVEVPAGRVFTPSRSSQHAAVCIACAQLCDACAQECEAFKDDERMLLSARTCRDCAKHCRDMSKLPV
jgi:flavoprotein